MSDDPPRLSRARGDGRPAAPRRLAHLGLGNFFRAHQAWYTDHAPDAAEWGITAFTGRRPDLADRLTAQDGLYTLVTKQAAGNDYEVISSLSGTHGGADTAAWLDALAGPHTAALTLTVTEAAYRRGPDGDVNRDDPAVCADIDALRSGPAAPVTTIPARLVAGLAARRRSGAGLLAVIPCDNLADNGSAVRRVVLSTADAVDPALREWIETAVSFVATMVDRITPRATDADIAAVRAATGRADSCPVVTEPFSEWVLAGEFPAGRPQWESAGAQIVDDVAPFERRKLWLLNGAHSLLAYAGGLRGHVTVADAMADEVCRSWLHEWWSLAISHLDQPAAVLTDYTSALVKRFENPAMAHLLAQIAADGSQKLPVRVLPVLAAERAAGRVPPIAARILAAWVLHLRGAGVPVTDPDAQQLIPLATRPLPEAVTRVLDRLDPALGSDSALASAVLACAQEMSRTSPSGTRETPSSPRSTP